MKMHIIQTIFDFYMHDKAEFESFDVDFVFRETNLWENSGENEWKTANSAL